jgi:hypothetical protein
MAPQNSPRTDTKLLLSVAGVVVAGAIGIALVAGLAVRREASPVERAAPRAARASTPLTPRVAAPAGAPTIDEVAFATPADTAAPAEIPAGDGGSGAIEIDPQADPWREGNRAYHTHEYALAAAYFEADAVARPERAYTAYMLALARWKAADLDGAVEAMERSAALNARSVRTFVNLSRIHNARGDYESARQAAEQALTIQPDHAVAQYQLGRSLYNLGRVEEAVEALETCLTLDPAEADAHNLLGLIRLQRGDDVQALRLSTPARPTSRTTSALRSNATVDWPKRPRPSGRRSRSTPLTGWLRSAWNGSSPLSPRNR